MNERTEERGSQAGEDELLPPTPERWPTAEELREAKSQGPDPAEQLRELRRVLPLGVKRDIYIKA